MRITMACCFLNGAHRLVLDDVVVLLGAAGAGVGGIASDVANPQFCARLLAQASN
jgi:hypothetical protein